MKIVRKDNYNRENRSDSTIAENVPEYYGRFLVEALQERFGGEQSEDYFRLEADDFVPYTYEP